MKEFAYFPGCSLEKMASSYHMSAMETTKKLGIKLKELEDWNCCGATTYFYIDELLAYTLCARNLAIAEKTGLDVVAPCSACYKNMFFTAAHLKKDADLAEHVNFALEEDNLHFSGNVERQASDRGLCPGYRSGRNEEQGDQTTGRHAGCSLLWMPDRQASKRKRRCGTAQFFEEMLSAIGATPVNYPLKMRCCGGSLIISSRTAALSMVRNLLQCCRGFSGDVIATACPMCQVNLEVLPTAGQPGIWHEFFHPGHLFHPADRSGIGHPQKKLGIGKEFVSLGTITAPGWTGVSD